MSNAMLAYTAALGWTPETSVSEPAMPELPDIVIYLEQLQTRALNEPLQGIRLLNPFVLRSVTPPLERAVGRKVLAAPPTWQTDCFWPRGRIVSGTSLDDCRTAALAPDKGG